MSFLRERLELLMEFGLVMHGRLDKLGLLLRMSKLVGGGHFLPYVLFNMLLRLMLLRLVMRRSVLLMPIVLPDERRLRLHNRRV